MDEDDELGALSESAREIITDFVSRFESWIHQDQEASKLFDDESSLQHHSQLIKRHLARISQLPPEEEARALSENVGRSHILHDVRISWYILAYNKVFEAYHQIQNKNLQDTPNIDEFRRIWLKDVGQTLDTYHQLLTERHFNENWALKKSIFELDLQAKTDPLTGVLNRRGFRSELDGKQESGAFILLDLDNFKIVNDVQGHVEGDKILEKLSTMVQSQLRRGDLFGRIGGDEFAIWLPSAGSEDLSVVSETLRRILGTIPFREWKIGISAGVSLKPSDASSFDDLYAKADEALYRAKSVADFTLCFYDTKGSESLNF